MKKLKTRTYIVEITSLNKYTKEDIQTCLEERFTVLEVNEKIRVINATASAVRKLGDRQT